MNINIDTKLIGLIGSPVGHSVSPLIHNNIYRALNMNYIYMAFDVEPNIIEEAVEGMIALSFAGFNVTIPHKQRILEFLDDLDEEANTIGAVNTVKNENGLLKGYNTDGMGFISGLQRLGFSPDGKSVAIIGAGGAARAISVYLLKEGVNSIYILNRTYERGVALAKELNTKHKSDLVIPIERKTLDLLDLDLLVNTTSVGMFPYVDSSPLEGFSFNTNTVVVDIIYNPYETKLLRDAKSQGCIVQNGMDMLIGQALASIKIWTGRNILYEDCRKILKNDDLAIGL